MYIELGMLAAMLGDTVITPAPSPVMEGVQVERFGLYVLADDLSRASKFYEALFGRAPRVKTAQLIGFDVAGGLYAIASRQAFATGASRGSSVRPYVKVRDLEAALRRVQAIAPHSVEGDGLVREGAFSFFRFRDSEGNLIEFFSVAVCP